MVKGTNVKEVSKAQMEEELHIYSSHATDDVEGLAKALSECRLRHSELENKRKEKEKYKEKEKRRSKRTNRANFAATIIDELRDLLVEFTDKVETYETEVPDK